MRTRAAAFAIAAALSAAPADAQTLFEWPDTAVDLTTYETLEECHAVLGRIRETLNARKFFAGLVWRDTTVLNEAEERASPPSVVGETVRACIGEFGDPETAPVEAYRVILPMYVIAGWDDRARTYAARRLDALPDTGAAFAAVLDTVFDIYLGRGVSDVRMPQRVDLIDDIAAQYLHRVPDRVKRFLMYWKIARVRDTRGELDTARTARMTAHVLAVADSMDTAERRDLAEMAGMLGEEDPIDERMGGIFAYDDLAFLDSLAVSTEAYARAKRDVWHRALGASRADALGLGAVLAEPAPSLESDIMVGCANECGPRPVPGRVNLVVFLSRAECGGVPDSDTNMYRNCAGNLIPLRRLEKRFPELEVTVVARTKGYFAYIKEGLTLEEEARLTREWLDSFGVQGVLSMTETQFWRISEHDRRRIDQPTANHESYTFGRSIAAQSRGSFLIDQDGRVVHTRQINRHSEPQFAAFIEVLLARGSAQ